jgi:hypothetical protein
VDDESRAVRREQERRRREAAYNGEVLRLRLEPPQLAFDPRRVEPHRLGTWYGELYWRHPSGAELDVSDECVVDTDWRILLVAQPGRPSAGPSSRQHTVGRVRPGGLDRFSDRGLSVAGDGGRPLSTVTRIPDPPTVTTQLPVVEGAR